MTTVIPREEIRFAVVLNGGVSLAVWMGGVVLEIDRLTRGEGPYGDLLALIGGKARADVISGTSAGGINGAALALSQVNELGSLRQLRDLWAEQGDIDALMRRPFRGTPVSLLQGDEYFLPQLRQAFQRLVSPYRQRSAEERPVDLTITTTLLRGAKTEHVDALGQKLPQTAHDGRFRFRHESRHAVLPGQQPSTDFDADHIRGTVARLALAARSTASFPMAFEPSYVPVDAGPEDTMDGRPEMSGVASWRDRDATAPRPADRSRFAVDGGLLANTPTREALEAIDRLPAEGPVRRVMLLVYPHAMANVTDVPDRSEAMPSVLETSALLLGALSSQGSRTFVEEIDRHNRAAASRRISRSELLDALPDGVPSLYQTAESLRPLYRSLRIRRAARDLATRLPPAAGWPYERTRRCAEQAQNAFPDPLPYVPQKSPVEAAADIGRPGTGWSWGVTTVEHLAESALDLLSRLVWVMWGGSGEEICRRRAELFDARLEVRRLRDEVDRPWTAAVAPSDWKPDEGYWLKRLAWYQRAMLPPGGEIGEQVREQALAIAGIVTDCVARLPELTERQIKLGELKSWLDLLTAAPTPEEAEDDRIRTLSRLLALEILTTCLAEETDVGLSQPVELVQISLMTRNPFAKLSKTPRDKGAGLALSRFAGFLKQSWRINDWTWGRLDASATLCRILLNPERLRRIAELRGELPTSDPEAMATTVVEQVVGTFDFGPLPPEIDRLRAEAILELLPVYSPAVSANGLPTALHALSDLAIWSVQARIAAEELPVLAKAAEADAKDGGNARSRGMKFTYANSKLLDNLAATKLDGRRAELGVEALNAFDQARIGHEDLGEEAASDRLIRTTVEAASVAVTVLDSGRSGLPVLKPVTRALRGTALLPYWAIRGVTSGGSVAKFLALLGFSLGSLLLVLALLGALPSWATGPAAAAGAGALLGTFAYGALRTGTFLHGTVLLAPAIPLMVYALTAVGDTGTKTSRGASIVLLVALIVLLLIILGSLPARPPSPIAVARRLITYVAKHPGRVLSAAGLLLLLAGLTGLTILLVPAVADWLAATPGSERTAWMAGTTILLLIVMSVLAWWLSFRLGAWTETEKGDLKVQTGVHPAASAAGWSIVYAIIFLGATAALMRWARAETWRATEPWVVASIATALVFAVVLLLIVPWLAPWQACRRIARDVIKEATRELYPAALPGEERSSIETRLIERLRFTGLTYRYFLCAPNQKLALTRVGRTISARIERKLTTVPDRLHRGAG